MEKATKGTLITAFSAVSFGTYSAFANAAFAEGAEVSTVLFFRFFGTAIILFLFMMANKNRIQPSREQIIKLLLVGGSINFGINGFFNLSLTRISASLTCMLLYLYPAMVTLTALMLKQEIMTREKALALFLSSAGLFLLLGASFTNTDSLGIIFALMAACCQTVYTFALNHFVKSIEPYVAIPYLMLGASASSFMTGIALQDISFNMSPRLWLLILGLVICSTVFGHLFFGIGIKYIGPSRASLTSILEPLVTALLAFLFFGESLIVAQMIGGFMIILAIIILHLPSREEGKNISVKASS